MLRILQAARGQWQKASVMSTGIKIQAAFLEPRVDIERVEEAYVAEPCPIKDMHPWARQQLLREAVPCRPRAWARLFKALGDPQDVSFVRAQLSIESRRNRVLMVLSGGCCLGMVCSPFLMNGCEAAFGSLACAANGMVFLTEANRGKQIYDALKICAEEFMNE